MYAIKVKDGKRWYFVNTHTGGSSWLKIHASRYESKEIAQKGADSMASLNPGREFKVVEL